MVQFSTQDFAAAIQRTGKPGVLVGPNAHDGALALAARQAGCPTQVVVAQGKSHQACPEMGEVVEAPGKGYPGADMFKCDTAHEVTKLAGGRPLFVGMLVDPSLTIKKQPTGAGTQKTHAYLQDATKGYHEGYADIPTPAAVLAAVASPATPKLVKIDGGAWLINVKKGDVGAIAAELGAYLVTCKPTVIVGSGPGSDVVADASEISQAIYTRAFADAYGKNGDV